MQELVWGLRLFVGSCVSGLYLEWFCEYSSDEGVRMDLLGFVWIRLDMFV